MRRGTGRRRPGDGLDAVAEAIGEPLSAAVYTGDYACGALAMSQADADDQAQADELIAEAGEVNPVTGFAMAAQPGGDVRVAMAFENDDQARTNADTRARPGRGPGARTGRRLRRPVRARVGHRRRRRW